MDRIKKVFVRIHVSLWILFTLVAYLQHSQKNADWQALAVSFILTCLFVFYGHFFLLTKYSGKKKNATFYLCLSAIIVIGPLIYLLLPYRIPAYPNSFIEQYVIYMLIIAVPFIFLSWLARVTENLVINTFKKEQLEKQAVEAELYYLKSQINPHFLFNTLNNIHTLVYKQAATAPDAVMQLASLMRYMIYESNADTVPLSREMDYLQDYISLQQLRYKQNPVVDLKIEGSTGTCNIAPLLFIHLLENAYKHSPGSLNAGDVKVRVEVKKDTLTFSVQNPVGNKQNNNLDEPGGIGLPNVKKRLALLYPDQHTLEINNTSETFTVVLKIHDLHLQPHERKANLLYNR